MKRLFIGVLAFLLAGLGGVAVAQSASPLRVFIRAGVKTHGPGQHDHPRFLQDWQALLNQRGARAEGAMQFPTAAQLEATDVLVLFAQDAGDIASADRANLERFLKRGGGLVVIHDALCGHDAAWFQTVIGGAWEYGRAGYFEGDISFYYQDREHPITRGCSNFDFNDEMYYHLHLLPEAHMLAATYQPDARNQHDGKLFPSIYDISPQMWTYEKDNYRAFVSIPGHNYTSFNLPHYRAVLLRGIAWAGKRDADLLVSREELASLPYPAGGPTAPAQAAAKIFVPRDFTLNLVASEPLIEKPISLDWDARGRLWVAETPEYPYRQDRSRPPRDRISILEDVNGDGCMDRKTVFYEGLDLVTSLVFYRDGVIVSQAPDIYWLRDTMGSGHADTKVTLYTGFGNFDTHAVVSNLRWGLDGWIYATVGYSRGDIYSGDREKHFGRISEGVIRFRPDGSALEQVSSKGGNTWGVDVAADGEVFFTQANGNHLDHVVMPEAALSRGRIGKTTSFKVIEDHNRSFPRMAWTKQAYVQIDWIGNFTAASGCCLYNGGAWPEAYNGTHYVAEPTLNIVHQDVLRPDGATYVASRDGAFADGEFVSSSDLWFRPIHQRVGPDGALYLLDFYNQAVIHNDPRGVKPDPKNNAAMRPDRDHHFGRIWRVQHKLAKPLPVASLDASNPAGLAKTLEHPNMWARVTAQRLLLEQANAIPVPALKELAGAESAAGYARIQALWTLREAGALGEPAVLLAAMHSADAAVRKNAFAIAGTLASEETVRAGLLAGVMDAEARARLAALLALGNGEASAEVVRGVTKAWPALKDPWLESAALGVAAKAPVEFIQAALDAGDAGGFTNLVQELALQIGEKGDAKTAASMVRMASAKPPGADELKQVLLEGLARGLKADSRPDWTPELQRSFQALLATANLQLASAALPLLARWDTGGALGGEVKPLLSQLKARLADAGQPDDQRARFAASLLAARRFDSGLPSDVAEIAVATDSPALQQRLVQALGRLNGRETGGLLVGIYPRLTPEARDAALNDLLKRPEWARALLEAIQAGGVPLATLGPIAVNRLRTHSDSAIARRANEIIDDLRGPEIKAKDELIAKFTPVVSQPGDAAKGHELFARNCAVCHRFQGEGRDLAPDLTGMGVHGPAELIVHVLDPNRQVEPNYYAFSIETRDGETHDGIIARENKTSLTLRNASGDMEIKVADIARRRNTGLSLMPNGFEALGGEALRDILAYLCAGETRYRVIDLSAAFTANSAKGLWYREDNPDESLPFTRFDLVRVDGVPFEIVNPLKSGSGNNLIALKGGEALGQARPQSVEIRNVGLKAARLHFLGGVGGWAYPYTRETVPVAKVTVQFADKQSEEILLANGREFADYIRVIDVPGSKLADDVVARGQVRWFTKALKHHEVIQSIRIESFGNGVAPVFVAITADAQ